MKNKYIKILLLGLLSCAVILFNNITALGEFYFYFIFIFLIIDIVKKREITLLHIWNAGFLTPPLHLEITKMAYICLMSYDTTSLNQIYCAPNKIWEYSKFGKPIISQYLPGIDIIFNQYFFGESCDLNSEKSVNKAVKLLSDNYSEKSDNAKHFYKSFDYLDCINNILIN